MHRIQHILLQTFCSPSKSFSWQQNTLNTEQSDNANRPLLIMGSTRFRRPRQPQKHRRRGPTDPPWRASDRLVSPTLSCRFGPVCLQHPSETILWPPSWRRHEHLWTRCDGGRRREISPLKKENRSHFWNGGSYILRRPKNNLFCNIQTRHCMFLMPCTGGRSFQTAASVWLKWKWLWNRPFPFFFELSWKLTRCCLTLRKRHVRSSKRLSGRGSNRTKGRLKKRNGVWRRCVQKWMKDWGKSKGCPRFGPRFGWNETRIHPQAVDGECGCEGCLRQHGWRVHGRVFVRDGERQVKWRHRRDDDGGRRVWCVLQRSCDQTERFLPRPEHG